MRSHVRTVVRVCRQGGLPWSCQGRTPRAQAVVREHAGGMHGGDARPCVGCFEGVWGVWRASGCRACAACNACEHEWRTQRAGRHEHVGDW